MWSVLLVFYFTDYLQPSFITGKNTIIFNGKEKASRHF